MVEPDQLKDPEFLGFRRSLIDLPRYTKRSLLVVLDTMGLTFVLWAIMSVRYSTAYWPENWPATFVLLSAPLLTVATFGYFGLYRQVTRYLGTQGQTRIMGCVVLAGLIWSLLVLMTGQFGIPRSVIIAYMMTASMTIALSRHMIGWILRSQGFVLPRFDPKKDSHAVLIYGAARAGVELADAISRMPNREVVGFFDNSPNLWGQYIGGMKVYRPEQLKTVIDRYSVKEVLLAIPSHDRHERRLVLKELENHPVAVNVLPSLDDIASGRVAITDLRPLEVQDLLGRDAVPPQADLLSRNTRNKSVLVTGAGGSVGAELARQVMRQSPAKLVLFDLSEPALYEIDMELREAADQMPSHYVRPEIVAVLGSVLDSKLVCETIKLHTTDMIYHAAAYKHVPIVESNVEIGLTNNIFGTEVVADAALAAGVERMVLISTDKAVRPTNVMGASKRIAELVLQARAAQQTQTVFTMVRFGNVLDSSGSVVKRFRRQINAGGPVTVTHPEIIRYFMSIPEAADLVIQAGAMALGGDVFVLDMGEPVKIDELARLMVRLSGREVRDAANPDGDIEIVYTGLRPGEKLYEELLIGATTTTTEHPRILRSDERALSPSELDHELALLKSAMSIRDRAATQAILLRTVEGYTPETILRGSEGATPIWIPPSRTLH